ncbi:serine hydrolase domain-containing protein [Arenibacter sp. F20364]|uniref:serine hydrolase domain-containing protein n=1 Tax=Arenibacter sp. F20364 TaxID=2926415 RepID=UPI001FF31A74|nr:serine hydrolase domain-containing protein [Arenibacter sp. F20364]MCK0192155.1 beta-lactamase family protein [Arenibacter sp. F20364]
MSIPDPGPKVAVSSIDHLREALATKEALLYKKRQEELRVAINSYFDKAIAAGDIVGAGVSIVQKDSVIISDGYGKRNINRDERVDGGTIFRLGSLSKGFAGVLAAELKDEGKLHWEDKVSDFIPEFRFGDRNNTSMITLANILSHTSGTPYHSYTNLVEAGLPLQDIAQRFKEVTPISEPGLMYSYQNAMFALCGEMIHKATGQDISEVLANTFFDPLGMCSTTMDYETLAHMENVAMPHSKRRNGWRTLPLSNNYYNAIAAGGISASSVDMAKWMRFLLGHNPELMSKSALAETFAPFIEIKGESKYYQRWPGHTSSYYGYGWRIHKFKENDSQKEKTIWHHGGSVNNYRNEIALYPEADLGICVLLSNNSRIARTVIPDLYEIVKDIYGQTTPGIPVNKENDLVQLHLE